MTDRRLQDPFFDLVVTEDVPGSDSSVITDSFTVYRDPDLWRQPLELAARAENARVLLVRNQTIVDADLLRASSKLRIVARAGVGLDNIDVAAADALGIVVLSARGANSWAVAEHTLALALALTRTVVTHDRAVRNGDWRRTPGREIRDSTWGILGCGATGLAVATLAKAFGAVVLGYDPLVDKDASAVREAGVRMTSLPAILAAADILSLHLPASPSTDGMMNAGAFAAMKPQSILINVGRGSVVDERALFDALVSGHLAGVGLDVRAVEPPAGSPLDRLDNVVLTPHIAGITSESQQRIVALLAGEIRSVLAGDETAYAAGQVRRVRP